MADANQKAWVGQVLGVAFAGHVASGAGSDADLKQAASAWQDAIETVDAQISALQRVLSADGDSELKEIAEFGLNAVTGGFKVKLMAALMGAERGDAKSKQTLAGLIPGFRTHLATDERVEACDDNPFDVPMSIRATLIPALDQLARSVGG